MSIKLLDKHDNVAILLAGIFSIIISIGIARFAFTSLLPSMLEEHLTLKEAGVLASFNFFGYLSGAIFSMLIKDIYLKIIYLRLGIFLSIIGTLLLATTSNELLWLFARVISGFGTALLFLIGSSLVMLKLNFKDKTKAMGIHFSGIGFAILVSEVITQQVLKYGTWADAWMTLVFVALSLSLYVIYILSFDKSVKNEGVKYKFSTSIFSIYVILLILAYFTEGVGFVIQGTFLPDIINSLEGLDGYGNLAWLIVGLAGVPSSILWMRLAHRYGSVNMIIVAMLLQIVGIIIPTLTNNIYINLFSGALYGSTFIGLVALFMNRAGQLAKDNPVVLMGAMTSAYGIGQVLAPLYSVALISKYGNYNSTLFVTAFIVFMGVLLLILAKRFEPEKIII